MKTEFTIKGMSCGSCVAKVKNALESLATVTTAEVDKTSESVEITSKKSVELNLLKKVLANLDPKYAIEHKNAESNYVSEGNFSPSWFITYRPIIIAFTYILLVTLLIQFISGVFDLSQWMRHFMAGFFMLFSFFKMLDLTGFANSYMAYDIIAKRWNAWGFLYAFIELGLGISYLLNCCPLATNITAFLVMTISIIGVLQTVLSKQKIQCACLGSVFELPMSTVTIIEDALMIVMSGYMIFKIIISI